MRYFFLTLISFAFLSCGGGGKNEKNEDKISDRYFYKQWYLAKNDEFYKKNNINQDAHLHGENFYKKYKGRGVNIAVIDEGLDVYHEDLKGAIKDTYSAITRSSDVSSNSPHGTGVVGLIGARANKKGIYSPANKSNIIFLQYNENMSDYETIELFKKAVDYGADVINCSWGTGDVGEGVKEYIENISKNGRGGKGVVVVFAVGNDNNRTIASDESAIKEVISVGSTSKDNLRADYSNYGKNLDLLAPGGDMFFELLSLDVSSSEGKSFGDYAGISGTSASAPLVSSVVGMMLEANPSLTSEQIQQILKDTADKIGDEIYEDGFNERYGYGKVNIQKALQKALKMK